jgi:hypothetical protein
MRFNAPLNIQELNEMLSVINAQDIIPVLEKGIEIERLNLCIQMDNEEIEQRIRGSRFLLCLLRDRIINPRPES